MDTEKIPVVDANVLISYYSAGIFMDKASCKTNKKGCFDGKDEIKIFDEITAQIDISKHSY